MTNEDISSYCYFFFRWYFQSSEPLLKLIQRFRQVDGFGQCDIGWTLQSESVVTKEAGVGDGPGEWKDRLPRTRSPPSSTTTSFLRKVSLHR